MVEKLAQRGKQKQKQQPDPTKPRRSGGGGGLASATITARNGSSAPVQCSQHAKSVNVVAKQLSCKHEPLHLTLGYSVFGLLVFALCAAPSSVPLLYLAFSAVCLPWRVASFISRRLTFFLLDFCYVSTAAVLQRLGSVWDLAGLSDVVVSVCNSRVIAMLCCLGEWPFIH